MIAGILREPVNENRAAMLPGEVAILKKMGIEVLVETQRRRKAVQLQIRNISLQGQPWLTGER
ncbi:MAG: hypothetical protein MZV63_00805 [Marinilabiliales bacterium]|nr:hypothetical protein [Marinilabiliales bacterium]